MNDLVEIIEESTYSIEVVEGDAYQIIINEPAPVALELSLAVIGPKGETGVTGLSAYEIAVEAGFIGTEAQWLRSLVGSVGNVEELPIDPILLFENALI